jgi:2'-5' RNA ligase
VRLFVAVEIDPHVAAAAAALTGELRRRAERLAPKGRITWIPEDRLHMTVRFIGSVDEGVAATIREALEPAMPVTPFDLVIAGIGTFPGRGAPRVVWAGIAAGAESLSRLEQEVSRRLASLGIRSERRPYRPHLTLGRVREAAGLNASRLCDGLADQMLGTTRVEAITLFESRLSPAGPAYVALQRTPLWKNFSS